MYDVASGLAYDRMRDLGKLAMSIGGENRVGRIGASAICRYVGQNAPELKERLEENDLSADVCIAEMGRLAKAVPTAMSEVLDDAERADLPGAAELGTRREELCRNLEVAVGAFRLIRQTFDFNAPWPPATVASSSRTEKGAP